MRRKRRLLLMLLVTAVGCDGASDIADEQRPRGGEERAEASDVAAMPSGDKAASDARTDGTKRMATLLERLAAEADPEKTPSSGPATRVARLREQLNTEQRPEKRISLKAYVGWHLLQDGQTTAALREFDDVRSHLDSLTLPPEHPFFRNLRELTAIAYLRYAEQQNCLANHSPDSCIMPIRGDGFHRDPVGAIAARDELLQALRERPGDIRFVWLLNLTYMVLGQYPNEVPKRWLIRPSVFESDYDVGRFRDVATAAGVNTIGLSGGCVADDLDGDGLLDIMASDWGIDKQLRLYINQGDGRFRDTTQQAGLIGEVGGLNLVHADYDNDGDLDVLVLRGAWLKDDGRYPNSLLRNLGDGRFDDVTEQAGLLSFCPTQTAAWADYDLDGFLDLFIGNETSKSKDYPCQLYHNNGDGTFTDVAAEAAVANLGWVKGVSWGDFDNDGYPDLYLSRFGETNVLYRNLGGTPDGWRFVDVTAQAGVDEPLASFPTWFWDYDNDGWLDILVAPFSGFKFDGTALTIVVADYLNQSTAGGRVHLYRNLGDGKFVDVAPKLHLDSALLAMGANFGDLDNDGWLDCYFGTGDPHFATLVPNRMFRNVAGEDFQDVTTSGGFGHIQKGHGIAFADFDNDGDQDIYSVMGGAVSGDVYQNVLFENPGHDNHWITLRLRGHRANRLGVGARIRIQVKTAAGSSRNIFSTVGSGGSFGASSLQQEIGLGDAQSIELIEIQWPIADSKQTFRHVEPDRAYVVSENEASLRPIPLRRIQFSTDAGRSHHHMP